MHQRRDDRHRFPLGVEPHAAYRPDRIARHGDGVEAVCIVGQQRERLPAAELGDEQVPGPHPFGQFDRPHVGASLHHLEVEQPPVGVEQHVALVVLLAGGGVARYLAYGEVHPLAEHRLRESPALGRVDAVRGHVDELDPAVRQAEGVGGHLEIDPPRARLEQEADARFGAVHLLGRRAEEERGVLHLAQRDRASGDRVGEAAVGHQLAGVEERQQRVELAPRVAVACAVEVFDLLVAVADQGEVAEHLAVEGEGGVRRLHREVIDRPR